MKRVILVALALSVSACAETDPVSPDPTDAEFHFNSQRAHHRGPLRVLTRNVYVGADVDVVLAAQDPAEVPLLVAQAYQQLVATNFPERATALAREIARTKPHLVGLQEISTIRIQSPGDAIEGGTIPAETVVFDYLDLLIKALHEQGEHYTVAARVQNPDVEVPMVSGPGPTFDDIRLTDYDVILTRRGVAVSDVTERNYDTALPIPQLGIEIKRGFTAVTAQIGKNQYRFVNTHLEPAPIPQLLPVQLGQAQELIAELASVSLPVVLVGDLNTHAPTGATYQMLLDNGYVDSWRSRRGRNEGFTCCHDSDLRNQHVNFDRRIDYVLGRPVAGGRMRAPVVRILGDHPREKTPGGLWPSDHAGVWALLGFSPPQSVVDR